MSPVRGLALAMLCALTVAGCGGDNNLPTTPTTPLPSTSIFASHVTVGGSAARNFPSRSGTITVRLRDTLARTPLGLGLGLPYGGVSNCTLNTTVEATPSTEPQISATVDAGSYCVVVYDLGTLTATTDFDVLIVYP